LLALLRQVNDKDPTGLIRNNHYFSLLVFGLALFHFTSFLLATINVSNAMRLLTFCQLFELPIPSQYSSLYTKKALSIFK